MPQFQTYGNSATIETNHINRTPFQHPQQKSLHRQAIEQKSHNERKPNHKSKSHKRRTIRFRSSNIDITLNSPSQHINNDLPSYNSPDNRKYSTIHSNSNMLDSPTNFHVPLERYRDVKDILPRRMRRAIEKSLNDPCDILVRVEERVEHVPGHNKNAPDAQENDQKENTLGKTLAVNQENNFQSPNFDSKTYWKRIARGTSFLKSTPQQIGKILRFSDDEAAEKRLLEELQIKRSVSRMESYDQDSKSKSTMRYHHQPLSERNPNAPPSRNFATRARSQSLPNAKSQPKLWKKEAKRNAVPSYQQSIHRTGSQSARGRPSTGLSTTFKKSDRVPYLPSMTLRKSKSDRNLVSRNQVGKSFKTDAQKRRKSFKKPTTPSVSRNRGGKTPRTGRQNRRNNTQNRPLQELRRFLM